jgi:5'-AMP-activated protein kinase regulatory gamma subunit
LDVATPPLLHEHPSSSLYDAAKLLIQTHARRLPLLDRDTETGHEVIVSVLTQYRLLKFIAINVCFCLPPTIVVSMLNSRQLSKEIQSLHLTLRGLKIGTYVHALPGADIPESQRYSPIATAQLSTRVFDVVHMFSARSISAVPIIDDEGVVVNLYETVDVIVRPFSLHLLYCYLQSYRHLCDWEPTNPST